ncbi:lipid-A-disaccharide synthase N-terminal domain-containing protein [Rhodanobacter hydrolyticus]|uniref:Lipid-A-disaccharide synthase N-terminal domain-containing protein n=2 Tax=Rhodanobacter hydrolyticus TaxID=2250595 RepID=A0ABW8J6V1_9GAMM|nr:lipid-A-disaccharide synthase N-terminal domain-containing protein [Rhodanobacter sp. 7MK24]MBD8879347.1 lipid-A-disaccharide synthase N-terminal domain-containing protein [Rhodanobacter sp. 7MK24]
MGSQLVFSSRFLMQWIYSEWRRESSIPMSFWYASAAGSIGLLAYAIERRDPVFIVGQATGLCVYCRNIQLRRREARADIAEASR